jgi:2'-deoxynucleoside 5'-phosphate N-hydrolase
MKIYYAHSITWAHTIGEREPSYIIPVLQSRWHEILSEEIYTTTAILTDREIYIRDKDMIDRSDIILANLTNPSLWVGYELWYWEANWKRIIWFFQWNLKESISRMITGNSNIPVHKIYNIEELQHIIKL